MLSTTAEEVTAWEAARVLGMNHSTLRRAAKSGLVSGREEMRWDQRRKRYVKRFVARLEAWRAGREALRRRGAPPGTITAPEAARRLGIYPTTARKVARSGVVPGAVKVGQGGAETWYATPEAWREGWAAWQAQRKIRRGKKRKEAGGMPRAKVPVPPEVVEARLEELRKRRAAFAVFVLAVRDGRKLSSLGLHAMLKGVEGR